MGYNGHIDHIGHKDHIGHMVHMGHIWVTWVTFEPPYLAIST